MIAEDSRGILEVILSVLFNFSAFRDLKSSTASLTLDCTNFKPHYLSFWETM